MSQGKSRTDDLANQLRAWRQQEKLTQAAAAALIGISPSHLGNLESGIKRASVELVMRIQRRIHAKATGALPHEHHTPER